MRMGPCSFLPVDFVAYLNYMRVGDFVRVWSPVVVVIDILVGVSGAKAAEAFGFARVILVGED